VLECDCLENSLLLLCGLLGHHFFDRLFLLGFTNILNNVVAQTRNLGSRNVGVFLILVLVTVLLKLALARRHRFKWKMYNCTHCEQTRGL
jgi:hypothetical protein